MDPDRSTGTVVSAAKPKARGRKSDKKRGEIIRAAIEIINAKSFALATMTEIAASLDLRDATLYYYFENKQALVYACHTRSLERFERVLSDADDQGGSGLKKLKRFFQMFIDDSLTSGPQLYFGDYSYLEPFQRDHLAGWAERLTTTLENYIADGIDDGSIARCEPAFVVQLLLGMLIWLAKWAPAAEQLTPERLMSAIDTIAFKGLAASGPGG